MMDGTSLALAAVVVLATLIWLLMPSAEHRRFNKAPGPPGLPLFGNIFQVPRQAPEFYEWLFDVYRKYKQYPLCRVMFMRSRFAFVWSAEAMEAILSSNKEITKSDDYKRGETWLGDGLLSSTGQKWFTRRRMLTPSFHFRILGDFLQVFNEHAGILVDKLAEHVDGEAFNVCPRITLCTLDIICDTAMGKHVNAQDESESEYVKAVNILGHLGMIRLRNPLLWPKWIFFNLPMGWEWMRCIKIVKGFTKKVIKERYEEFQEEARESEPSSSSQTSTGRKKRMAFLDTLLSQVGDGPDALNLDDVQEEVDTFMFALLCYQGHDTTSASIAWAIYNIGAHPEVQEKLQQEMTSVLGDEERYITEADLKQLKYLECVIKESMRIYATVPVVARRLQDDLNMAGIVVPKGTAVLILPLLLNYDERYFPEPHKFDPERFTLENSAGRPPYAYVPFSAGPRNCIGQKFAFMEMKVVLSYILRRYHIEVTQKPSEIRPILEAVLRSENGLFAKLTRRA